jgi:hypothetical protein
MKTQPLNLFMLASKDRRKGQCSVCGERVFLIARDTDTGFLVGQECVMALVAANKAIEQSLSGKAKSKK